MTTGPTPASIAAWMLHELERQQFLYQQTVVYEIAERFGDEFVYYNNHGNLAIDRRVLKEFRDLTGDSVVWDRSERLWRKRAAHDMAGREQH